MEVKITPPDQHISSSIPYIQQILFIKYLGREKGDRKSVGERNKHIGRIRGEGKGGEGR
jgi:hypothetical protein